MRLRSRLRSPRTLLALAGVVALLALGACGDDDESADTAGGAATEEQGGAADETAGGGGGGATVEVGAVEFAFEPPDPALDEGGDVSIELVNEGSTDHALEIEETGDSTAIIAGGETDTLTTNLDPGEYVIFCPVGNHRQLGMEGTLTVGGGESSSGSSDSASAGGGSGGGSGGGGSGGGY